MTRASRLSTLSTNAWAHTRTRTEGRYTHMCACTNTLTGGGGIYTSSLDIVTHYITFLPSPASSYSATTHNLSLDLDRLSSRVSISDGRPPPPCISHRLRSAALEPHRSTRGRRRRLVFLVYATSILRLKGTKNKQTRNSENAARNEFN